MEDQIREIFDRLRELETKMSAHIAREELRDDAMAETMEKILEQVESMGRVIHKGQGAVGAFIAILGVVAAIGAWIYDHFNWTAK